jgi:hypothetical protein
VSYDATTDTRENAQAVQNYLAQERTFQEELLTTFRADAHYGPYATEEAVARNRRLLQVWDALALAICFGGWQTRSVPQVPTATSATPLTLRVHDGDPTHLMVTPWPFRRKHVTLVYEGRHLAETFPNEEVMREALKHAPWVTLKTTLLPDQLG